MKFSILLLFIASAIVSADEGHSVTDVHEAPPRDAANSAAQQFEKADVSLAVAHYKRLKEKTNALRLELALKLASKGTAELSGKGEAGENERKQQAEISALKNHVALLDQMANEWRAEVMARADKSASTR
jgi:hypothetical protein